MPPPKPRSQSCGASGCRGRRSRAASAGRSRRSARRCAGSGSAGSRLSTRPWQSSATRQPGELIHIDSKKLGRIDGIGHRITGDRRGQSSRRGRGEGLGWEALHVAIDDASRLAYTEILPDEKKTSATAFLERALGFFERHGIKVERVMTDNGSAYKSWLFRKALANRGIRHKRTRPYTPRTNGKAERFIQTSLREWLYARPFQSSAQRTEAMPAWLCDYNTRRPHAALGGKPPISKLKDNVLGNDT